MFGHEKGAFTGAHAQQKGKIEYAQEGTLFLDEIEEMAPSLQAKLLRFLEDHAIERVGGRRRIEVDVRVIAATHRDLQAAIAEGIFREDLYYRLAVVTLAIPPLREQEGNAPLLARHFLERFSREMGRPLKGLSPEALQAIEAYRWPGNVRQLENAIRQALILAEGESIGSADMGLCQEGLPLSSRSLRNAREETERAFTVRTLEENG